jgi:hypothetical protein
MGNFFLSIHRCAHASVVALAGLGICLGSNAEAAVVDRVKIEPIGTDCPVQREVPWTWTLAQTTGPGKNNTSVYIVNDGPMGTVKSASSTIDGAITIAKIHNPGEFCQRLTPLPAAANVKLHALLDGGYANTTLAGSLAGIGFSTSVDASAAVSLLGALPAFSAGTGSGRFSKQLATIVAFPEGVHPYTGTLDASTLFGFGGGDGDGEIEWWSDFITLFAQLQFNATLAPLITTNIVYTYPAAGQGGAGDSKLLPLPIPILEAMETPSPNPPSGSIVATPGPLPLLVPYAAFRMARRLRRHAQVSAAGRSPR